ncbi:hypothetical protein PGB90_006817 [Kerria lacca]
MESNVSNFKQNIEEIKSGSYFINLIKTETGIEKTCTSLVSDLRNGTLSLRNLTENLETLLVNEDISLRRGGTELLATVLSELPDDFLKAQEIIFILDFYCNLLQDHHSFIPIILKALLALVKMKELPDNSVTKIFTALNLYFVCQSQPQGDRNVCYQLFNIMMSKKTAELQSLGPDFVCGYLTIIDSERDPRNLMFLFEHLPKFYQNFPPGHLLEDAFEAVSCYFPVDFRANPEDPSCISREDLSNLLIPCITAIADFCPFAVALALDKLTSDLKVAKIDSLILLKQCCKEFLPAQFYPSVNEIITVLLEQLKPGNADAEVQKLCAEVLACILKYLADDEKFEELTKILDNIFSSIHHFLNDIHLSYFNSTIKLLTILSYSCRNASLFVSNKILSKLIVPSKSTSSSDIRIILESFKLLLPSCIKFNISSSDFEFEQNWKYIPELFTTSCQSPEKDIKILALEGACLIIQLFDSNERYKLYLELCRNIKFESDMNIRQKSTNSLKIIAETFPDEVKHVIDTEIIISDDNIELNGNIFEFWCSFASVPGFLSYLNYCIKTFVINDSQKNASLIINSLKDLVIFEKKNVSFLSSLYHDINITRYLMDWWHEGCNAITDDLNKVFDDEQVAQNLQFIISIIIRIVDKKWQLEDAFRYFELTIDYSKKFMNSFQYLNVNEDLNAPKVCCSLSIITFEGVVNGILPTVLTESLSSYLGQLIKFLTTLSIFCSRPFCCVVACRIIAVVFNKIENEVDLEEQLKYVYSFISSIISNKDGRIKKNAVQLLIYITKSLLLRGYPYINSWFDMLLSLINCEDVSIDIADGFRIILQEEEFFLGTLSHCTIKLFYRQRFFSYMVPKLVDTAKNNETTIKTNCAVSVIHLSQNIPQNVLTNHFKQIIPLLTELLKLDSKMEFTHVTLQKLSLMLKENKVNLEQYVESFISQLLILSSSSPYMKVRIAALNCLFHFCKLNLPVILPFKARVIHELTVCLDDRKRLVRQEAVKTRIRWIVLGTS